MTPKRAEPFLVALHTLRERLREGAFGFERRLAATEIAEQLELSPTPVREALARLAGEGLLEERRGQGYFVRRPSAVDVADLYRMSLACLQIALEPRPVHIPSELEGDGASLEPDEPFRPLAAVARVERLFDAWVAEGGGHALAGAHRRLQAQLGPIRRHEPLLIPDLAAEAQAIAALGVEAAGKRIAAVRVFHRRRMRLADRLAAVLESRPRSPPL